MKDSERISNLEEMSAEILMRLDRAEAQINELRKSRAQTANEISSLDQSMRELAKYIFRVDERQTLVEDAMDNLTALQKLVHESLLGKEDLDRLFEFTMRRFDKVDQRFDAIDRRLDNMDVRMGKMDARMDNMNTDMNNRFDQVSAKLARMDEHFEGIDLRFDNIDKRDGNPTNSKS